MHIAVETEAGGRETGKTGKGGVNGEEDTAGRGCSSTNYTYSVHRLLTTSRDVLPSILGFTAGGTSPPSVTSDKQ